MKKVFWSLLACLMMISMGFETVKADTVITSSEQNEQSLKQDEIQKINKYNQDVSNTIPINSDTLNYFIKSGKRVIIYFGYSECPHCQKFVPVLHKFIDDTGTPVFYLNVKNPSNVSTNFSNELKELQVTGTPTVLLLGNGKTIYKYVGDGITENQLMTLLWMKWNCY